MFLKLIKKLDYDWVALVAVFFLLIFGLMAIYSLSLESDLAARMANFQKQSAFLFIGVLVFFLSSRLDYRLLNNYASFFYLLGLFFLLLVLFLGRHIRGSSGWFSLGLFNVQPVEPMKIFLIILMAKYFSKFQGQPLLWKNIWQSFCYMFVPFFLAFRQPDMGSALVMLVIWLGMIFLAGLRLKQLLAISISVVLVFSFSWNWLLHDYQKSRIESFVSPQSGPLGKGYNVIQSVVAVGSGGFSGKGLGHGSQSRLNFLPEKHTDFIFATIAEESGLVGAGLVLGLFALFFFRLYKTMLVARDNFGRLLVGGIMIMVFFQILVTVGMNVAVMPIVGLALPFLSYGGSFLITMLFSLGIIQSVWKKRKHQATSILSQGEIIG